jgi:pantoate--beta-alanine ligase
LTLLQFWLLQLGGGSARLLARKHMKKVEMMTLQQNPQVVRNVTELRRIVQSWRSRGDRVAMVPTMGALHEGHLSLIRLAKKQAERVVASIFVNPTQFGPTEDLARYPRDASGDKAKLASVACDLIFTPDVAEIYPDGFATDLHVRGLGDILCGVFRPGHFDGVAIVVSKLLLQGLPDYAIFGEKDFQQLHVIKRVVADLNIPTEIIGAPILREADGLAMSSRNAYLSIEQRKIAGQLNIILRHSSKAIAQGADILTICATASAEINHIGFTSVDYVSVVSEKALTLMSHFSEPARILVAARLGMTRLIDNMKIENANFNRHVKLT